MVKELFGEMGCYYYCDAIQINAFGIDEIQEIIALTVEVVAHGKAA